MGSVQQKPRHKAGPARQATSQGLQVERTQLDWGDETDGLNRVKSRVLWGMVWGTRRSPPMSSSRATLGKSTKWALGAKLWSQKGFLKDRQALVFPGGLVPQP